VRSEKGEERREKRERERELIIFSLKKPLISTLSKVVIGRPFYKLITNFYKNKNKIKIFLKFLKKFKKPL